MAPSLGRIDLPGEVRRGLDLAHRVRVPATWLVAGATVRVRLPRLLSCAACSGGGCDACGRAGAVSVSGKEEAPKELEVSFGARPKAEALVIRIPERGAPDPTGALPRGVLLLTIVPGEAADAGVELACEESGIERVAARELDFPLERRIRILGLLALVLVILFVLVLKLARLI